MAMETLSEVLQRLSEAGYTDDYRADGQGLRSRSSGMVHPPDRFKVDEIVRFEGDSDPGDESAVFALTSEADGTRGTYTVAYGPIMDALDAKIVRLLAKPGASH
jgi:hypothetical protein